MKPDNRKAAVFPGSFDPFTLGHLDVLKSALKLFDRIVIAVGYNHLKHGFMTPDNRVGYIKECVAGLVNVGHDIEVVSYTGLTVDFCKSKDIKFIIRGLRTTTDFELESVIAQANKRMDNDILTVFIPASHDYSFISSTVVRDVIVNGGDASAFVPEGKAINKYIEK